MHKIIARWIQVKQTFRKIWLTNKIMAAEVTPSDSLTNDEMPPVKKLKTCDDDVKDGQVCIASIEHDKSMFIDGISAP